MPPRLASKYQDAGSASAQRACLWGPRAKLVPHLLKETAALAMWLVRYLLYNGWSATVVVAPKECDSSVVVLTPACITSYKGVCVVSPVQRSVQRMLFGLQNIG